MQATINLLPKQSEAWDYFESPLVTELGYGGAAGGGKTRLGCYIAITIAELYPKSRGAIGRKELKTLRLTTLSELFLIFSELGYKQGKDYVYQAQDGIIKFSNGSEVLLLDTAYSPQDPEYTRFGSLNLTWAWIEESNETPEKAKSILKTRVGRHNKFNGEIVKAFWLETFNPNKGHVYRDYYRPWKEGTLPEYRKFIRALPGDNPHLPEAYIKNLERADKITRERLLLGNFEYDADPLKLMRYDYINDLFSNTIKNLTPRYMIVDVARFGGDKIIIACFDGLKLYKVGAYTFKGIDETTSLIKSELSRQAIPYSHCIIDEDGVGGGVVDNLRGVKGFMGNSRPFPIAQSPVMSLVRTQTINSNFSNLRSQCYFKLSDMVNEHKMLVAIAEFDTNIEGYTKDKAINDLVEELDAVKQKEDTGVEKKLAVIAKDDVKEVIGRSPDLSDVMMMRMFFEFKSEEAIDMNRRMSEMHTERHRNIVRSSR